MTPRPDARTIAAARLVENAAHKLPAARQHIRIELSHLDGHSSVHPGHGDEPGVPRPPLEGKCTANVPDRHDPDILIDCGRHRPCGLHDTPVELTRPERVAAERIRLGTLMADIDARVATIAMLATDLLRDCDRLVGTRVETPRCDGGVGRDGYHLARSDGGWSEPDCENVPAEGRKTCDACRKRAQRWKDERAREKVA
jgi:hypothetical protein